jgi:predicted DNA-binding transcriptional regulator AlpA
MNIETYLTETIEEAVRKVIREELEDLRKEISDVLKSKNRNATEDEIEPESKIVRPKELANMLSLSISTLYKMQQDDILPPKIKISNHAVGWLRTDIEEWLINRRQDQ